MKICLKCEKERPIDDFGKKSNSPDGRRSRCKDCSSKQQKAHRLTESYKTIARNYQAKYQVDYRMTHKEREKIVRKRRLAANLNFRLACNLRSRLSNALRGAKAGSAIHDLGCSVNDLRLWLERQFQPGMSWENYGLHGWHIDHVKALSKFDLSDRSQIKAANHFTNLQPLWAEDNLRKHAS